MRRGFLQQILAARREGRALVRALDLDSGHEQLIDPVTDDSALGRLAAGALEQDASCNVMLDGRKLLLTVYSPPREIVIVGAVHIAQALAALGIAAGYRVRVIDPRTPYASAERFAGVSLVPAWPDEALALQPLTATSALIVLAHDPKLEDAGLAAALRSPAFYIGALGSARTQARRLRRLAELGFTPRQLGRIHGPVGLSIGARSPAEIAIAILAEIIQMRRAPAPQIASILLAAGMSTRMGGNKLTMPFRGKPLVRHAAEAALAAAPSPVIVVTGHEARAVREALAGLPVRFVHNDRFADGLSTSLQAGLRAVPSKCDGALVLLGDMPAISPDLIDRVAQNFAQAHGKAIIVAKAADGGRGHPILWGRAFFAEIETLEGDQGARILMERHADAVLEVESGDESPLLDIDTPDALRPALGSKLR